jgi:hypothetical protein
VRRVVLSLAVVTGVGVAPAAAQRDTRGARTAAPQDDDEPSELAGQTIEDPEPPMRAAAAAREASDPRWRAGRVAVAALAGLATPLGFAGIDAAYDLSPDLGLYAGGGIGLAGPQVALGARVAIVRRGGMAYLAGAGLSWGDAEARQRIRLGGDFVTELDGALWLNADNAFELRGRSDWFLRAALGFGVVVAATDCAYVHEAEDGQFGNPREESTCTTSQKLLVWPSISLAVGRGF